MNDGGKNIPIENAVIIHGPGRSGTTLLNNILSLNNGIDIDVTTIILWCYIIII